METGMTEHVPVPTIQNIMTISVYLGFNKVNKQQFILFIKLICSSFHHFNVTLLEATGCKQVCPPAVNLQKTLKASEVQPKFGSTQNQPESNQFKERTERERERYFRKR